VTTGTVTTRLRIRPFLMAMAAVCLLPAASSAQDASPDVRPRPDPIAAPDQSPAAAAASGEEHKRIFGIIPNYRTSPTLQDYQPLTPKQKFATAAADSFDRGTFALGAMFAAEAQLTQASPSFGHGVPAYARYFAASTADFIDGDLMTEAIFPTLLREDPRYFRRGTGSTWSRLGYAVGQIFWTHTDSGGTQFNWSEVAGNATAVAIGNAYYPDNRTLGSNVSKLGLQIGVDVIANILKEFSPDLDRRFTRPHSTP
jgi:hypothetical protein